MNVSAVSSPVPRRLLLRGYLIVLALDALFIVATFLSDLGITLPEWSGADQLDLKLESNLAVWYSSLLLLIAGGLALLLARGDGAGEHTWQRRVACAAVAP